MIDEKDGNVADTEGSCGVAETNGDQKEELKDEPESEYKEIIPGEIGLKEEPITELYGEQEGTVSEDRVQDDHVEKDTEEEEEEEDLTDVDEEAMVDDFLDTTVFKLTRLSQQGLRHDNASTSHVVVTSGGATGTPEENELSWRSNDDLLPAARVQLGGRFSCTKCKYTAR